MVMIRDNAALGYVGKKIFDKTLDIVGDLVKKQLEASSGSGHKKTVEIFGPDGKVVSKVDRKSVV